MAKEAKEYAQFSLLEEDIACLDLIRHLDAVAVSVGGVRVFYSIGVKTGKCLFVHMSSAIWALACKCSVDRARKVKGKNEYSYPLPFKRVRANRKPITFAARLIPEFDAASHGWEEVAKGVYKSGVWTCDLAMGTARRVLGDGIEVGHDTFTVHGATYPMVASKSISFPSRVITVKTPGGREVKIEWKYEKEAEIAKRVHAASLPMMDHFIDAKLVFADWKGYINNTDSVTFSLANE